MTSPQTAQSRAGGTGSTAVITFEAVMKQSNEQNRDLTIADVAGRWMLNSRCHLFLLQKTPLATSLAKTARYGSIPSKRRAPGAPQRPRTCPRRLLTFWDRNSNRSLCGKRIAVVLDQCNTAETKTQPPPFLRVIIPRRGPSARYGVLATAPSGTVGRRWAFLVKPRAKGNSPIRREEEIATAATGGAKQRNTCIPTIF